ncbi:MAG: leucyl aminopeptidase [Acidobacteria bacterium]|nr:leucyl aminopeptidase [Acidobacteriota bacterium]
MEIEYRPGTFSDIACDLLAYPVFEEEAEDFAPLEPLDRRVRGAVRGALESGEFKPELHRTCTLFPVAGVRARRLLLVGAGKKGRFDPAVLRDVAGTAVRAARAAACRTTALLGRGDHPAGLAARVAAEGALYADYEADIYKTRGRERRELERFYILLPGAPARAAGEAAEGIRRGVITGEATNFARTLANEPANILTPARLAERAREIPGLAVRTLDREEMERMGMHALLAVSRGSAEPPGLIVLEIPGEKPKRPRRGPLHALVGKGVTFDSGGISLKPADKMEEMKGDMAGGAAVLGAMAALARLKPRVPVIGLVPAVENLPGGRATRPGDVVTSYLGKTVEIINTDAEGRLILADALAYARTLGAARLLDVATLTGACMVALGRVNAGMMGTDQKTMDLLRRNCRVTGEGLWQLPMDDAYRKAIRSEIADVKNIGDRWGGAITAAKFLEEFTEDTPWVHLDIAGMDLETDGRPFACKGATGFGVRTLVGWLE